MKKKKKKEKIYVKCGKPFKCIKIEEERTNRKISTIESKEFMNQMKKEIIKFHFGKKLNWYG